ncbi:5-formyltetrahydrofolate cyclo-ligase [Qipengyuania nanhaisediminis]|uniref:5-formyltetrahydrofolate cyclo-ligase n=1 Tax=Qipengyuania nanhaisediminis TaxID=604088 RepID=A0A1I5N219_9SPHN|nr:5-formyltetrahydrofolate cyclo-ligase [Qipengyuania nanhaisediminis]SFP15829.1 5-formyltetrahydrofolate cyclo-ligase [Qipengyuania nanhaisediminis]
MTKDELRKHLRTARRDQVAALPDSMRALVFHRPPAPLLELLPEGATIGLYRANPCEAPAASYAKFFLDRGHEIALPRFASSNAPMEFARHSDPFDEEDLEVGPFGLLQPFADAPVLQPDVLIVPLIGFTETGERLGQGGGHYDRWLAAHPDTRTIGLAWDCQRVDSLPVEEHDARLDAIVTTTRFYGPFA